MIEVIIGLVFTYLLLSLLATTLNELIASWRGWRGFFLEKGLKKILEFEDNPAQFEKFQTNALFQQLQNAKVTLRESTAPSYLSSKSFVAIFLRILKGKVTVKELIKQLPPDSHVRTVLSQLENDTKYKIAEFKAGADNMYEEVMILLNSADDVENKLDSYIKDLPTDSPIQKVFQQFLKDSKGKTDIFKSKVEYWYTELVQVLNGEISVENIINQLPENGKLKEVLEQLREEAGDDIEAFKARVENWYEELMDRATGWYKKHLQVVTFFIGLGIAITFNADTFSIYEQLATNSSSRESIVQLANEFVAKNENTNFSSQSSASFDSIKTQLNNLLNNDIQEIKNPLGLGWHTKDAFISSPTAWLQRMLGWIITALAISLGAPFWFDILKKIVSVRGAGRSPKENKTNIIIKTDKDKAEKK